MDMNDFQAKVEKIKCQREAMRGAGINDYNLLRTVLSSDDEVRLHSRILHSLLDPNGEHHRGALFLEKFLEVINERYYFESLEEVKVEREKDHIDLLLSYNDKYIIIENKINANDQEKQLARYIEVVAQKGGIEDILVIYLSVDREKPTSYSLGNLNIEGNELKREGKRIARYKAVHYKHHMLEWLDKCISAIASDANLRISLEQYRSIVKQISGYPYTSLPQYDRIFEDNYSSIEFFCKNEKDCENEFERNLFIQLKEAYIRAIEAKFVKFLKNYYTKLFNDGKFSMGEICLIMNEPCFRLNFRDIEGVSLAIYLKSSTIGSKLCNGKFFKPSTIALRETKNWSMGSQGTYHKVYDRIKSFHQYLRYADLEDYIVGKNKGPKLENGLPEFSLKEIFSCSSNSNKCSASDEHIEEIKNHIEILEKKLLGQSGKGS